MTSTQSAFTPKQAIPPTPEAYAEIVGDGIIDVVRKVVEQHGPLASGSVVHDNACGPGSVTRAIAAAPLPPDVQIHATDIDAATVQALAAAARAHGWPVVAAEADAEKLPFPAATFTHSFATFFLQYLADGGAGAAAEMRRTLKPGGLAVVTSFADVPHQRFLADVHRRLRGAGASPLRMLPPPDWNESARLTDALAGGGFAPGQVRVATLDMPMHIPDLRRWCALLWSLLGCPVAGWAEGTDEEIWDEAVRSLVALMRNPDHWTPDADGDGGVYMMKAWVATATKS